MKTLVYDIEVFPNVFTCCFSDGTLFEISWRKNQVTELIRFLGSLDEMVGFNNVMFDYPVLHFIIENQHIVSPAMIFNKSAEIINTPFDQRYSHIIWEGQRHVKQIDLYLIHHFDNIGKFTSLKSLQIAMRSESVEDLPFKVGQYLLSNEIDQLIEYNRHDVSETSKFWEKSKERIDFRRHICIDMGIDVMNFNDLKIGKKYFENELEKINPGCCRDSNGSRQTSRKAPFLFGEIRPNYNQGLPIEFHLSPKPKIEDFTDFNLVRPKDDDFSGEKKFKADLNKYEKVRSKEQLSFEKSLKEWPNECLKKHESNMSAIWFLVKPILFHCIQFDRVEFQDILKWYQSLSVTKIKGGFSKECSIRNFTFRFGAGGIHGSIPPGIVRSNETHLIRDVDVTSFYPSLAIKHLLHPEHLGLEFCQIYENLFKRRQKYKKGTVENAVLKLALNGVYGDSNNPYSPFLDPKYTMSITINGQLLLAMLAEKFMVSSEVNLIQINTDGLTIRYPRTLTPWIEAIEDWWMKSTRLTLESVNYQAMFIRDVNNYIGWFENGTLKRRGAYSYDQEWHQDPSGLVIKKAVESYLIKNTNIEQFIKTHKNKFDFMIRGKVNKNYRLVLVKNGHEIEQQRIIRFYFSKTGGELFKYMSPLKKNPGKIRRNAYQGSKGWRVKVCNHVDQFDKDDVDFDYYIEKAHELIEPLCSKEQNGSKEQKRSLR